MPRDRRNQRFLQGTDVHVDRPVYTKDTTPRSPLHKCTICLRYRDADDSAREWAKYTDDVFIMQEVVQPLVKTIGPKFWIAVCGECCHNLVDEARERVSWTDPKGHYILSPTEEQYGREVNPVGLRRRAQVDESAAEVATDTTEEGNTMTDPTYSDESMTVTTDENVEANSVPVDAPIEEAPATTTNETPKETAEAKALRLREENANKVRDEYPVGALVELIGKGDEYRGCQGEVVAHETVYGVTYPIVKILVNAKGQRRRPGIDKIQTRRKRLTGIQRIDAYRPEPVAEPETVTETSETQTEVESVS